MKGKRQLSAKNSHKTSVNPSGKRTRINLYKYTSTYMNTYMHKHTHRNTDMTRQWDKQK